MGRKKQKKKNLPKGLPETFVERLSGIVGTSQCQQVLKTFIDRPTTFRVNTLKAKKAEVMEVLADGGFKTKNVSWYGFAFILQPNKTKRELTELDLYTSGKIYIQSLASMVPPLAIGAQPGEQILDLTAAPGSKTSQIAAAMRRQGELVANELNKVRFFRLKANMDTLGVSDEAEGCNFIMRMEDGSALCRQYSEYFDRILVDAPCSGEARFIEGVPKTYGYWNEKKIKRLAFRQHKLLLAAWSALKPGGVLVYSTCTMAPEENEARIDKLVERLGSEVAVEKIDMPGFKTYPPLTSWKRREYSKEVKQTLRVLPTEEIEGFFVARLRKNV